MRDSNILDVLASLFSFLITQLGNIANFFTGNLIGQIILACGLFGLAFDVIYSIIKKIK